MTLIAYKEQRFAEKSLKLIEKANEIIADFQSQGYTLTLRQLYYQFITQNYFPNSEQSYNRLGETISNARLAGLVSWDAIEDKTRFVRGKDHWNGEDGHFDFMRDSKKWFNIDMWENQPHYVEVWIEKDALLGVIERPCWELDVPYMSCRGYMSQSEEWAAANRFSEAADSGRKPVLIYLGDHDPSGIDMSRDHTDRLAMFLSHLGAEVDVRRVALNIDQVHQYNPPANPTKPKDSRSPDYVRKFGRTCWELRPSSTSWSGIGLTTSGTWIAGTTRWTSSRCRRTSCATPSNSASKRSRSVKKRQPETRRMIDRGKTPG